MEKTIRKSGRVSNNQTNRQIRSKREILINVRAEELDKARAEEGKRFEGTVKKAFGQVYFLK